MKGIVPSLNTPFNSDGSLDHASLRRLINHTVEAGCGGMLALAVAGEHATLTTAEKAAFIETATNANGGRIPFIVSVTAPLPDTSFELAKIAAEFDVTGVCVQLPDAYSRAENLKFLQRLADHVPGILMVQDLDWAGDGLSIEDIQFLFEQIDQFTWLKIETKNAGPKYSAVLEATHGKLNVCGGWAVTELPDAMARGVHAFIPTGMERVYVRISKAYDSGDVDTAITLFQRLLPVLEFSNQHIDTSIRFFKELRKAEGLFDTNVCRVDLGRFDAADKNKSELALKNALALMNDVDVMASRLRPQN